MKGLFLIDILTQKKQIIRSIMGIIGIAAFMILVILSIYYGNFRTALLNGGFLEGNALRNMIWIFSFGFAAFGGIMVNGVISASFEEDENADFGKVCVSLPVSRKERVITKYLYYLSFLTLSFFLNYGLQRIMFAVAKTDYTLECFLIPLAGFSCFVLITLLDIPFIYRFGVKSRIVFWEHIVLVVILSVLILVGMNFCMEHDVSAGQLLGVISGMINILAVLFPLSLFVGVPISALCSIQIQKKGRNCIW